MEILEEDGSIAKSATKADSRKRDRKKQGKNQSTGGSARNSSFNAQASNNSKPQKRQKTNWRWSFCNLYADS